MVRCLEMLAALGPASTSAEFQRNAVALRAELENAPPNITAFTEQLLERPPSVPTRFEQLATALGRANAKEEVALFRPSGSCATTSCMGRGTRPYATAAPRPIDTQKGEGPGSLALPRPCVGCGGWI